jgi:uncharacterized protein (DUF433 family)
MEAVSVPRITIEPGKCGGRPCIRGMRIRVSDVLSLLAAGATHDEILSDFPALVEEDIRAALSYAAGEVDRPKRAPS